MFRSVIIVKNSHHFTIKKNWKQPEEVSDLGQFSHLPPDYCLVLQIFTNLPFN